MCSIFHLLVYFLKPGGKNSIQGSHLAGKNSSTRPSLPSRVNSLAGNWNQKQRWEFNLGTLTWDRRSQRSLNTVCHNTCPPLWFSRLKILPHFSSVSAPPSSVCSSETPATHHAAAPRATSGAPQFFSPLLPISLSHSGKVPFSIFKLKTSLFNYVLCILPPY